MVEKQNKKSPSNPNLRIINKREKKKNKKQTSVIFKSLYLGASLPKKPAALGASVGRKHTVSKQWLLLTVFSVCVCVCVCVCMLTQSRLTLYDPMDCRPSASSVHGIILTRILEWIDMPFSRGSSWPRDRTSISCVSCIGRQIIHPWVTWEALAFRKAFPERDELRQGSFVSKSGEKWAVPRSWRPWRIRKVNCFYNCKD